MKTKLGLRSLYAVALTVVLPLGLTACGDNSANTSSETSSEIIEGEEDDPTESVDAPSSGDNSTSTDKPTKDEVVDGIAQMLAEHGLTDEYMEASGGSAEQLHNYYVCTVDGFYDDVSTETLENIANGKDEMPDDEQALFDAAADNCVGELGLEDDTQQSDAAKPSKQEVVDGIARILEEDGVTPEYLEANGITSEQLNSYYTCIVDEIYDVISIEALTAFANGQDQMHTEDQAPFNEAVTTCQGELG
ncbi:hypothetical protein [Flaviflexus massiliensis]|uniref:hypothetical protein n=1 Tax=Flaviflexus massiliensis TaxID=1522309 RepID=UPI0011CA0436|nr:hypothetical protein [Flaviflexus massiliensis]